jgi:predicted dehydrogenase
LNYVGPLLGNPDHWVRKLPGQLLHNIISHGIGRLAEFLDDEIDEITVSAHQSVHLRVLDDPGVIDELRAFIRDRRGTTAMFCFSTQIKPGLNQFRICGPVNSIKVDLTSGTLVKNEGRSYKSYLTFLVPPINSARAHFANARQNAVSILRRRMHQDSGMKELIEQFHSSVQQGGPPPIAYRDIVLTARIMDSIFDRMRHKSSPPIAAGAVDV